MSPEDALPNDPALAHLRDALDGVAMAGVFGGLLRPHGDVQVQRCDVERVKYRPGRNCTVSYRLALRRDGSAGTVEQRVAARFRNAGNARGRAPGACARSLLPSRAGPAVSHVPQLDMVAHWCPNDAKLGALGTLFDDGAMRCRWLPEVAAALGERPDTLGGHRIDIAQYVPEHRVSARVDLRVRSAANGNDQTRRVYAKADAAGGGLGLHRVLQALHESAAGRSGRLRTPRPVPAPSSAAATSEMMAHWLD